MSSSLNVSWPSTSRKQHKPKKSKSSAPVRRRQRQASQLAFSANHDGSTLHSILQSLLTLYCLLTLTLGVVVPISDALAKPVEHADYRQMFYLYMHIVGIAAIVYMNTLISCYGSTSKSNCGSSQPASCSSGVTTITSVKYFQPNSGSAAAEGDDSVTVDVEPSAELQGDEISPEAPATTSGVEYPESQQRRRSLWQQVGGRFRKGLGLTRPRSGLLRRRRVNWSQERHRGTYSDTPASGDQCKILWSAVGVNLYLRFGAIVFGFGVMAHTGFKIVDVLRKRGSEHCVGPWFLPKHVVDLLLIVLQTYFLFKHHKVTINTQRSLVRFCLIHLAVTNLCIWIKTVIYEIKAGLMQTTVKKMHKTIASAINFTAASYGQFASAAKLVNASDFIGADRLQQTVNATASRRNETTLDSSCVGRQVIDKDSPSVKLGPYLYPCAVEYGLICAAICYKFFTNVGNTEGATPRAGQEMHAAAAAVSTTPRTTTCHKSHRGLFSGLIITICVLVPMVSLLITQQSNSEHKDLHIIAMLSIETLVLACTTVVALFGAANVIRRLALFKLERHEAFDVNLLFVGLAGIVCYSLFVAISVGACMMTAPTDQHAGCQWGSTRQAQITQLTGLKALADLTQAVAQTLFIMQAIQRKITRTLAEKMEKPGRGITAALLIANLALWIASVFEFQRDVGQDFLEYYFGFMPWSIIQLIFQPLIIFYRFHSTVCLSEIWVHSYKLSSLHEHWALSHCSGLPRRKVQNFKE